MCADTVVVTAPDASIAVLQPTLTDAIAAVQLYAAQVAAAQAAIMVAQTAINNAETVALSAAASASASAAAASAAVAGGGIFTTVALLPAGTPGLVAWATNGRNIGEAPGSGTGVEVRYSAGAWRNVYNGAPVQA